MAASETGNVTNCRCRCWASTVRERTPFTLSNVRWNSAGPMASQGATRPRPNRVSTDRRSLRSTSTLLHQNWSRSSGDDGDEDIHEVRATDSAI